MYMRDSVVLLCCIFYCLLGTFYSIKKNIERIKCFKHKYLVIYGNDFLNTFKIRETLCFLL